MTQARTAGARERRIRELILRVLRLQSEPETELVRSEIPEWDSLKHMELVFALEDEFGVRFDETEFPRLTTPAAIDHMIEQHLAA